MTIKEALNAYIKQSGQSQNAIAKAMGISGAALSQFIKGKYPGNAEALEMKIAQFLNLSYDREVYPQAEIGYIDTSVSLSIIDTARNCHIGSRIGIVTGESGLGKTTAAKHYAEQNPDVLVVYGRPSMTSKSLIREIARKVGVDPTGAVDDVFMRIVYRLKDSGRLLIIDEAEHLTARVLDLMRRFNDPEFAGIGILLIGLPKLLYTLKNSQNDHKYIYSRVGWNTSVNTLTDKDCEMFVSRALPGTGDLWKTFADCAHHNARALCNLIERSIEIAGFNHCSVDATLVKKTAQILIS
ncbi:MAG: AAA family ATPase [Synergistaceae bacterium]|nr:AAA family ATPase [Synergistaceae bacterium]